MTENIFSNEELISRMKLDYPLGLGQPLDVANLVEFLVSDKSKWITGQQFIIDGGRTINISG
jgi:NAD(P)-dependent dehydrogenase (short-subunit alcohol dehydrogenase family)